MRILKENVREGRIRLRTENADDLWELSHIIRSGDHITASTERKIQLGEDRSKQIRKRMTLTIEAANIEFEHQQLRINGTITAGPEDIISFGDYHGMSIDENTEFELTKKWDSYSRQRLEQAINASKDKQLIVLFNREEAIISQLSARGQQTLVTLKGDVAKKQEGGGAENFWSTIARAIQELDTRNSYARIIAASPAFWTEYLTKELPEELLKKTVTATTGTVDESAVHEILRRPELKTALKEDQSAHEQHIVDEILEAISKDKACYGIKEVQQQAQVGRIKILATTTTHIEDTRSKGTYEVLDAVMQEAKNTGAQVHLLRHITEQIDSLGGIAGVLRW